MPQSKATLYCRYNSYDAVKDVAKVCGKRVPPGELTWLALNSRTGDRPVLCEEHRRQLEVDLAPYRSASVGVAAIVGAYTELPDTRLISEAELRQILIDNEVSVPKRGPLTPDMRYRAIKYRFGTKVADEMSDGLET